MRKKGKIDLLNYILLFIFLFLLFVFIYSLKVNKQVEASTNNVIIYNAISTEIDLNLLDRSVGYEEDLEEDIVKLYNDYKSINDDVVCYLRIRNSTMNFPLVQSHKVCTSHNIVDNCYYLYRDIYKRNAVNTNAISFVEANNKIGTAIKDFDQNTIIFGHTWSNSERNGAAPRIGNSSDKQLGQLVSYTDMSWLKEHLVLELTTGVERTYWVVQNVAYTDCIKVSNPDGFNYMKRNLSLDDLELFKMRSVIYNSEDGLVDTDKFLTLSTCNYKYGRDGTNRFVVVFKHISASSYNEALEMAKELEYIEQENMVDWK